MLDSFFIKKLFNTCILEFTSIVASNSLDLHFKLVLGSSCKLLESFLHFTLILQKENPSEARMTINNNKTVFVTANANICHRSEQIHMEQLQWSCCGHNILGWMRCSMLLAGLTCSTY